MNQDQPPHEDIKPWAESAPHLFQRRTVPVSVPARLPALPLATLRQPRTARTADDPTPPSFAELDQQLLAQYSPPGVIVSEEYEIVHLARGAGQFLQLVDGEPSHNLLKVIHPELRIELRAALFMAAQLGKQTETRRVRVEIDGVRRQVYLVVQPLQEPEWARGYLLVVFHDAFDSDELAQYITTDAVPLMQQLEQELQRTKNQLRTTIEQYETAVEEYRAGNEELQAINEELRAAGEELETSKEELQSVNEELATVNQELKHKIEELSDANNDLHNLMVSTEIATIFVDRELRLKRYTPSALAIFNLIPADLNRPLNHITHRLNYDQMVDDTIQVIETLAQGEREVASADGRWYLARLRAYHMSDNRIDGVVLTFVDITSRKHVEDALRASEERLRLLIEGVQDYAIFGIDINGQINSWNSGAERTFGYNEHEAIGQHVRIIFTPEDRATSVPEREMQQVLTEGRVEDERWYIRRNGERFFVNYVMTQASDGARHGFVKVLRDLTDRKQAEVALTDAHDELEQKVNERTSELATSNLALQTEIVQRSYADQARQEVLRQLVTAQEEERRRISRELHDQLGQQLSALRVGLAALTDHTTSGDMAVKLADIQHLAKQIDDDVDRLALDLRPSALDDLGLPSALQQQADEWSTRYGIVVDMQINSDVLARLSPEVEIVLYRLVQEALNNIAKHASAQSASLILEQRTDQIHLIVEDDGQGFDQEAKRDDTYSSSRLGLIGMQERVALVGGTLAVESQPGNGTTVFVRIPLHA